MPDRLVLFAFDLIALDGEDLRGKPLRDRRPRLQDLIGVDLVSRIHFSPEHVAQGPAFFRAADQHGLEGIDSLALKLGQFRWVLLYDRRPRRPGTNGRPISSR